MFVRFEPEWIRAIRLCAGVSGDEGSERDQYDCCLFHRSTTNSVFLGTFLFVHEKTLDSRLKIACP